MNERKNKMEKVDLNSKEIREKSHSLQQECIDCLENNDVYVTHFLKLKFLKNLIIQPKNINGQTMKKNKLKN